MVGEPNIQPENHRVGLKNGGAGLKLFFQVFTMAFFLNIGLKYFNIWFLKSISWLNLWPVEPVNADLIWSGISPKKIKHWCVGVWMNRCNTVTELKWNCLSLSLWNRVWSLQPCFSQNKVWITKCCDDFLLHRGRDCFRAQQLQQCWEQWLCLWEVLKWKEPRQQV